MDLSDVLWSQQQINRLSTEVTRLEAEAAHWRRMSQVFRFRIRKKKVLGVKARTLSVLVVELA